VKSVMPAKAGIQFRAWIPACAGMTIFMLSGVCPAQEVKRMEMVMGTLLEVSVEGEAAGEAVAAAFKEVRRWDGLLSNYKADSEISRLNREAYPKGSGTSKEMVHFLQTAQGLSRETSGYFEILTEPLTRLWGLRERKLGRMPSKTDIGKARLKADFNLLEIHGPDRTVRFLAEGAGIDTGGLGKGYALDRAMGKIRAFKTRSAILNFGGEILYWPLKPGGRSVAIKHPLEPDRIWKIFSIAGFPSEQAAVSTSADYERFVTAESGAKLSHILDPDTGEPVNNGVRSVTVVSGDGARADALSTALFVMGTEGSKKFAAAHPQDWVCVLYQEGSGPLKSFSSGDWKEEKETQ